MDNSNWIQFTGIYVLICMLIFALSYSISYYFINKKK